MTVYEEFLKVPEILTAEIIDGALIVSPHLDARHNRAANKIFCRVVSREYDDGEWWVYFRPELRLGTDIFVPEACGFKRERVPEPALDEHWTIAPDWICEVVSPSTGRLDRIRKLPRYATHGVRHAWMIDPIERGFEGCSSAFTKATKSSAQSLSKRSGFRCLRCGDRRSDSNLSPRASSRRFPRHESA